ncbi:glutaredoxin family protein [Amphritea japonica]|uniref:Glutaredoxin n=1 Tax=Amphritea japonica ATCC BAA-1530 TaxID=1278309 RepID=A0A7R6SSK3_9GAMM|nr:glutaredoxin family protein [Amphritea japonica]BBB26429.1 glutaredoxin [Amphritea japonica ATCC BAA-1530]
MRQFLLMGSAGCHLCDEAAIVIVSSLDPLKHCVDEVDIAYDDQLMDRYALLIPVLQDELSGAELRWPFDTSQLQRFIAQFD